MTTPTTLENIARRAIDGDREALEGLVRALRLLHGRGRREHEAVARCRVHGDLNLANVLVDDASNTWLVDYYWTCGRSASPSPAPASSPSVPGRRSGSRRSRGSRSGGGA